MNFKDTQMDNEFQEEEINTEDLKKDPQYQEFLDKKDPTRHVNPGVVQGITPVHEEDKELANNSFLDNLKSRAKGFVAEVKEIEGKKMDILSESIKYNVTKANEKFFQALTAAGDRELQMYTGIDVNYDTSQEYADLKNHQDEGIRAAAERKAQDAKKAREKFSVPDTEERAREKNNQLIRLANSRDRIEAIQESMPEGVQKTFATNVIPMMAGMADYVETSKNVAYGTLITAGGAALGVGSAAVYSMDLAWGMIDGYITSGIENEMGLENFTKEQRVQQAMLSGAAQVGIGVAGKILKPILSRSFKSILSPEVAQPSVPSTISQNRANSDPTAPPLDLIDFDANKSRTDISDVYNDMPPGTTQLIEDILAPPLNDNGMRPYQIQGDSRLAISFKGMEEVVSGDGNIMYYKGQTRYKNQDVFIETPNMVELDPNDLNSSIAASRLFDQAAKATIYTMDDQGNRIPLVGTDRINAFMSHLISENTVKALEDNIVEKSARFQQIYETARKEARVEGGVDAAIQVEKDGKAKVGYAEKESIKNSIENGLLAPLRTAKESADYEFATHLGNAASDYEGNVIQMCDSHAPGEFARWIINGIEMDGTNTKTQKFIKSYDQLSDYIFADSKSKMLHNNHEVTLSRFKAMYSIGEDGIVKVDPVFIERVGGDLNTAFVDMSINRHLANDPKSYVGKYGFANSDDMIDAISMMVDPEDINGAALFKVLEGNPDVKLAETLKEAGIFTSKEDGSISMSLDEFSEGLKNLGSKLGAIDETDGKVELSNDVANAIKLLFDKENSPFSIKDSKGNEIAKVSVADIVLNQLDGMGTSYKAADKILKPVEATILRALGKYNKDISVAKQTADLAQGIKDIKLATALTNEIIADLIPDFNPRDLKGKSLNNMIDGAIQADPAKVAATFRTERFKKSIDKLRELNDKYEFLDDPGILDRLDVDALTNSEGIAKVQLNSKKAELDATIKTKQDDINAKIDGDIETKLSEIEEIKTAEGNIYKETLAELQETKAAELENARAEARENLFRTQEDLKKEIATLEEAAKPIEEIAEEIVEVPVFDQAAVDNTKAKLDTIDSEIADLERSISTAETATPKTFGENKQAYLDNISELSYDVKIARDNVEMSKNILLDSLEDMARNGDLDPVHGAKLLELAGDRNNPEYKAVANELINSNKNAWKEDNLAMYDKMVDLFNANKKLQTEQSIAMYDTKRVLSEFDDNGNLVVDDVMHQNRWQEEGRVRNDVTGKHYGYDDSYKNSKGESVSRFEETKTLMEDYSKLPKDEVLEIMNTAKDNVRNLTRQQLLEGKRFSTAQKDVVVIYPDTVNVNNPDFKGRVGKPVILLKGTAEYTRYRDNLLDDLLKNWEGWVDVFGDAPVNKKNWETAKHIFKNYIHELSLKDPEFRDSFFGVTGPTQAELDMDGKFGKQNLEPVSQQVIDEFIDRYKMTVGKQPGIGDEVTKEVAASMTMKWQDGTKDLVEKVNEVGMGPAVDDTLARAQYDIDRQAIEAENEVIKAKYEEEVSQAMNKDKIPERHKGTVEEETMAVLKERDLELLKDFVEDGPVFKGKEFVEIAPGDLVTEWGETYLEGFNGIVHTVGSKAYKQELENLAIIFKDQFPEEFVWPDGKKVAKNQYAKWADEVLQPFTPINKDGMIDAYKSGDENYIGLALLKIRDMIPDGNKAALKKVENKYKGRIEKLNEGYQDLPENPIPEAREKYNAEVSKIEARNDEIRNKWEDDNKASLDSNEDLKWEYKENHRLKGLDYTQDPRYIEVAKPTYEPIPSFKAEDWIEGISREQAEKMVEAPQYKEVPEYNPDNYKDLIKQPEVDPELNAKLEDLKSQRENISKELQELEAQRPYEMPTDEVLKGEAMAKVISKFDLDMTQDVAKSIYGQGDIKRAVNTFVADLTENVGKSIKAEIKADTLQGILDVYKARYPELKDVVLEAEPLNIANVDSGKGRVLGSFTAWKNTIKLPSDSMDDFNVGNLRHEIQHALEYNRGSKFDRQPRNHNITDNYESTMLDTLTEYSKGHHEVGQESIFEFSYMVNKEFKKLKAEAEAKVPAKKVVKTVKITQPKVDRKAIGVLKRKLSLLNKEIEGFENAYTAKIDKEVEGMSSPRNKEVFSEVKARKEASKMKRDAILEKVKATKEAKNKLQKELKAIQKDIKGAKDLDTIKSINLGPRIEAIKSQAMEMGIEGIDLDIAEVMDKFVDLDNITTAKNMTADEAVSTVAEALKSVMEQSKTINEKAKYNKAKDVSAVKDAYKELQRTIKSESKKDFTSVYENPKVVKAMENLYKKAQKAGMADSAEDLVPKELLQFHKSILDKAKQGMDQTIIGRPGEIVKRSRKNTIHPNTLKMSKLARMIDQSMYGNDKVYFDFSENGATNRDYKIHKVMAGADPKKGIIDIVGDDPEKFFTENVRPDMQAEMRNLYEIAKDYFMEIEGVDGEIRDLNIGEFAAVYYDFLNSMGETRSDVAKWSKDGKKNTISSLIPFFKDEDAMIEFMTLDLPENGRTGYLKKNYDVLKELKRVSEKGSEYNAIGMAKETFLGLVQNKNNPIFKDAISKLELDAGVSGAGSSQSDYYKAYSGFVDKALGDRESNDTHKAISSAFDLLYLRMLFGTGGKEATQNIQWTSDNRARILGGDLDEAYASSEFIKNILDGTLKGITATPRMWWETIRGSKALWQSIQGTGDINQEMLRLSGIQSRNKHVNRAIEQVILNTNASKHLQHIEGIMKLRGFTGENLETMPHIAKAVKDYLTEVGYYLQTHSEVTKNMKAHETSYVGMEYLRDIENIESIKSNELKSILHNLGIDEEAFKGIKDFLARNTGEDGGLDLDFFNIQEMMKELDMYDRKRAQQAGNIYNAIHYSADVLNKGAAFNNNPATVNVLIDGFLKNTTRGIGYQQQLHATHKMDDHGNYNNRIKSGMDEGGYVGAGKELSKTILHLMGTATRIGVTGLLGGTLIGMVNKPNTMKRELAKLVGEIEDNTSDEIPNTPAHKKMMNAISYLMKRGFSDTSMIGGFLSGGNPIADFAKSIPRTWNKYNEDPDVINAVDSIIDALGGDNTDPNTKSVAFLASILTARDFMPGYKFVKDAYEFGASFFEKPYESEMRHQKDLKSLDTAFKDSPSKKAAAQLAYVKLLQFNMSNILSEIGAFINGSSDIFLANGQIDEKEYTEIKNGSYDMMGVKESFFDKLPKNLKDYAEGAMKLLGVNDDLGKNEMMFQISQQIAMGADVKQAISEYLPGPSNGPMIVQNGKEAYTETQKEWDGQLKSDYYIKDEETQDLIAKTKNFSEIEEKVMKTNKPKSPEAKKKVEAKNEYDKAFDNTQAALGIVDKAGRGLITDDYLQSKNISGSAKDVSVDVKKRLLREDYYEPLKEIVKTPKEAEQLFPIAVALGADYVANVYNMQKGDINKTLDYIYLSRFEQRDFDGQLAELIKLCKTGQGTPPPEEDLQAAYDSAPVDQPDYLREFEIQNYEAPQNGPNYLDLEDPQWDDLSSPENTGYIPQDEIPEPTKAEFATFEKEYGPKIEKSAENEIEKIISDVPKERLNLDEFVDIVQDELVLENNPTPTQKEIKEKVIKAIKEVKDEVVNKESDNRDSAEEGKKATEKAVKPDKKETPEARKKRIIDDMIEHYRKVEGTGDKTGAAKTEELGMTTALRKKLEKELSLKLTAEEAARIYSERILKKIDEANPNFPENKVKTMISTFYNLGEGATEYSHWKKYLKNPTDSNFEGAMLRGATIKGKTSKGLISRRAIDYNATNPKDRIVEIEALKDGTAIYRFKSGKEVRNQKGLGHHSSSVAGKMKVR